MTGKFNIAQLFRDVVNPQKGEVITFLVDHPHGEIKSNPAWKERLDMAEQWHAGIADLCQEVGARLNPVYSFPATGANNGDLPEFAEAKGKQIPLDELLKVTNVTFAMTEYSASAPLIKYSEKYPHFRAASLPGVNRGMEQTALAADYKQVARWANVLTARLTRAEAARVVFSTGHKFNFDLRYRTADSDDGYLHADKTGIRLINLPSGEACIVPYEGEREGEPSRTAGDLPVQLEQDVTVLKVKANRIVGAEAASSEAHQMVMNLMADRARQNIAELGLGCNPSAVVSGRVLEDEKVGFHWAYGRSDHLGGTVAPEHFAKPENVLHVDIVYALGCPITVASLVLQYADGGEEKIIKNGEYTMLN